MNVYLIRIWDRSYGFTVVALVATDEEDAKREAASSWRCYFGSFRGPEYKPNHSHAEVVSSCPAVEGCWCTMEFQE